MPAAGSATTSGIRSSGAGAPCGGCSIPVSPGSPGTPHLDRAPELLRDLVRHGHAERGLRPELTDDALAAVEASAPADALRAAVAEPDEG